MVASKTKILIGEYSATVAQQLNSSASISVLFETTTQRKTERTMWKSMQTLHKKTGVNFAEATYVLLQWRAVFCVYFKQGIYCDATNYMANLISIENAKRILSKCENNEVG